MPQMAPINWLSLFLVFSISFMIFNMLNYYFYTPQMPSSNLVKNNKPNSFDWKW